jgi:hypothetical protein
MTRILIATVLGLVLATAALAHAPRPGPNGGLKVDAGTSHHAELVTDGTTSVVVFLFDAEDKPVASQGYRATAILLVGTGAQRFPLTAGEGNRLIGTAPVPIPPGVKGALQITGPDGATLQAKF